MQNETMPDRKYLDEATSDKDDDTNHSGEISGGMGYGSDYEGSTSSSPSIIEGKIVESTLLFPPPSSHAQPYDQGPMQSTYQGMLNWMGIVLIALVTVLLLTPMLPRMMRLLVAVLPGLGSTATITLMTAQVDLHKTYTLLATTDGEVNPAGVQPEVRLRLLSVSSPSQEVTVPTTGTGYRPAVRARGIVIFYNQAPIAQIIPAGLLLSGTDRVQIATDQLAVVPAAHLPLQGEVSVPAHAVEAGPQGNIGANDLNGPCCLMGIAVQNRSAFMGGQDAQTYPMVQQRDLAGAAASLASALMRQQQEALRAQLHMHERLVRPAICPSQVGANHAVGEEATQVAVTVSVTCTAEVYNADEVQARVITLLSQEVAKHLGNNYSLQSQVSWEMNSFTFMDSLGRVVSLQVQAEGLWAYRFRAAQVHTITRLVAGKRVQEANTILLHMQGIHHVSISSTDWWDDANQQMLPADPNRIRVVVISWIGV